MIQSMTGFGKEVLQLPQKKITLELKSLKVVRARGFIMYGVSLLPIERSVAHLYAPVVAPVLMHGCQA